MSVRSPVGILPERVVALPVPEPAYLPMTAFADATVAYLWRPFLPAGKVSMLAGDPGTGKSTFTLWIAAQLTRETRAWPWEAAGEALRGAQNVLVTSAEDDTEDTVKPRLRALGADLARVYTHTTEAEVFDELGLDRLREAVLRHNIALVVADPWSYFMGGEVNPHKANAVRAYATRVKRLASETGAAVLFVNHLAKARQGSLLNKALGSIDGVAVCRSVMVVKRADEWTVLDHVKTNLAEAGASLRWRMVHVPGQDVPNLEVEVAEGLRAADLQDIEDEGTATGIGGQREFERACEWLLQLLGPGDEMPARELSDQAEVSGFAKRTIARAKAHVGFISVKQGRAWYVRRP